MEVFIFLFSSRLGRLPILILSYIISALFVSQIPTIFRHANLSGHVRPIGPMLQSDWLNNLLKQKGSILRAPGIELGTSFVAVRHSNH